MRPDHRQGRWARELLALQQPDGTWPGCFHSLAQPTKAPPTTEQAVIMLSSHFYESRDGSTGGFFQDNPQAAQQVWNTVNLLLRLDRDWKV